MIYKKIGTLLMPVILSIFSIFSESPTELNFTEPFIELNQSTSEIKTITKNVTLAQQYIITHLTHLYTCQDYWYHQDDHPISYFFGKSPIKWFFGKKQPQEIKDNIYALEQRINLVAKSLGTLNMSMHAILHATNMTNQEFNHLKQRVINALSDIIKISPDTSIDDLLPNLNILLDKSSKKYDRPTYIHRNWLQLSSAVIAILSAAYFGIKYQQDIGQFIHDTNISGKLFFKEKLQEPLNKIKDYFYKRNAEKPIVSEEMIIENQRLYKKIVNDYMKNHAPSLTETQINEIAQYAGNTNTIPTVVNDDFAHIISQPWQLFVTPWQSLRRLFAIITIRIQRLENLAYPSAKKIDTIVDENKVNLQLLVTIPALAVIGGFSYGAYTLTHAFNPIHKTRKKVNIALNHLELLLAEHEPLTPEQHGFIVYWASRIKKYALHYPKNQRNILLACAKHVTDIQKTMSYKRTLLQQIIRTCY